MVQEDDEYLINSNHAWDANVETLLESEDDGSSDDRNESDISDRDDDTDDDDDDGEDGNGDDHDTSCDDDGEWVGIINSLHLHDQAANPGHIQNFIPLTSRSQLKIQCATRQNNTNRRALF